jgi:hypothetical protein
MTVTTHTEAHGPVDFVLLEFPDDHLTGDAAEALADLVEHGVIRLYDLTVVHKRDDESVEVLQIDDVDGFRQFAGASSGLLDDEDISMAAAAMEAGKVAALIVYENAWAIPFVAAAQRSGGELIASERIPAPDVMAALDALESDR